MLIDSHCHLNMLDLSPYDGSLPRLVEETTASGVAIMLCIGTDQNDSPLVKDIASQFNNVYASVGIHPSEVANNPLAIEAIIALADHPKVVAIGETGLDYYYNQEGLAAQRESFRRHIRVAAQIHKPLIIHTRSAHHDTIEIMRTENAESVGGVMHCFTESWEMAKEALDLGFYISISGIVTFKNAENVRDVATKIPADRLLIETDAPYLAPVPMRGKKNEPKYVKYVAEFMAQLRNVSYEELIGTTAENFQRLFAIEPNAAVADSNYP